MSTNSRIGMVLEDGSVRSIYCHLDGYPKGNGRILKEYYKDAEKVKKLISLGDISYLESEVEIPEGKVHNFENKCDGVVVAYHRDRGEEFSDRTNKDIEDFRLDKKNEEWTYLFNNGEWFVIYNGGKFSKDGEYLGESERILEPLTDSYIDSNGDVH